MSRFSDIQTSCSTKFGVAAFKFLRKCGLKGVVRELRSRAILTVVAKLHFFYKMR